MKTTFRFAAATALASVLAFAAFAEDAPNAKTVLATVNGTEITLGHVIALRGRLPEQYQKLPDDVLYQGIVEQLIQQTVLEGEMKKILDQRTSLGAENEVRAFLAGEMLSRLSEYQVTEDNVQAAYDEKYDAAIPDQEFNASHILVKTEDEAKDLVVQLQEGTDFATLARDKSTGPSGPNGGELGWFGKGMMVPEFESAVVALAVGEISAPVQTQFGWHVVKLNDIRSKSIPTIEDVRADLKMELQQKHVEDELARLTEAATITRSEVVIDPAAIRDVSLFDN